MLQRMYYIHNMYTYCIVFERIRCWLWLWCPTLSSVSLKYPYFTFVSQSDTLLGFIRKYVNHCPAQSTPTILRNKTKYILQLHYTIQYIICTYSSIIYTKTWTPVLKLLIFMARMQKIKNKLMINKWTLQFVHILLYSLFNYYCIS